MGKLPTHLDSGELQIGLSQGSAAKFIPALMEQRQGQGCLVHAGGGMKHKRAGLSPRWVMNSDVVSHSMLFPQATEQQARHALTEVGLQQAQGRVIRVAVGQARLAEHHHHLLCVLNAQAKVLRSVFAADNGLVLAAVVSR